MCLNAAMSSWVPALLTWFAKDPRAMPWRNRPAPYPVWVSEIMLQQTQVATVIPYFKRFMRRFPTVRALAVAPLRDVLKAWQGLGYYARARNLHAAARQLVHGSNGRLPKSYENLLQIPGIGAYTAAAIASIAFGEPVPAVDGNVMRVCSRLWGLTTPIQSGRAKAALFQRLSPLVPPGNASAFNQALMELGARVCKPTHPACAACPLRRTCFAFRHQRTGEFPVKTPRKRPPHYRVAVALIWKGDRVLIAQRRSHQMLGGLWEFPGGKPLSGEPLRKTVLREALEETGLRIRVQAPYGTVRHAYSHFHVTLTAFRCQYLSGRPRAHAAQRVQWVTLDQARHYPLPRATEKIIAMVEKM